MKCTVVVMYSSGRSVSLPAGEELVSGLLTHTWKGNSDKIFMSKVSSYICIVVGIMWFLELETNCFDLYKVHSKCLSG